MSFTFLKLSSQLYRMNLVVALFTPQNYKENRLTLPPDLLTLIFHLYTSIHLHQNSEKTESIEIVCWWLVGGVTVDNENVSCHVKHENMIQHLDFYMVISVDLFIN